MKRVWKILTSLRLTVVLLALSIVLVFVGTIAQADEGLYNAQERYFQHWIVVGISFFGHHVPLVWPGGYLLGTALLINLLAAHIQRFQWTWKKLGIHLAHIGIVLLLVGQLTTDFFSAETQIQFFEGETKSFSEASRDYELALISDAGNGMEDVIAIPQSLLTQGGELRHEKLPATIRVKDFWRNSNARFRAPMQTNAPPMSTNGVGKFFDFFPAAEVKAMDEKNVPTALLEITPPGGSSTLWLAPGWSGDKPMATQLHRTYAEQMGDEMAEAIMKRLNTPQHVSVGGKDYTIVLRPARVYTPYSLTLLKATHTTYPGRPDLPKDFRSRVRLQNPQTSENRELEIYMNTPLRYAGRTFYQLQMSAGEAVVARGFTPSSTLQVVRNPSWLTPYAGCVLVGAGLTIQFLIHLVAFISKRRTA